VTPAYPFSAVVGLSDLRLALLLNAVSPTIGGVLVRGEKGTAKSTVVRALAGLLPAVEVVTGCRFSCDPVAADAECPDGPHDPDTPTGARSARLVELPVGATEDRLVGALDLQRALTEGVKAYEPGLLAAAHRGVLYVDEVNLLPDHLVDLLLDAAAMGRAYVERDGVSVRHAARFLLVGTMNPEEGELRPQLLDRFGLAVDVAAPREAGQRAEVVRRRLRYEADPVGFAAQWRDADAELAVRIVDARIRLPHVGLADAELTRIASVCAALDVDGLRADIVVARTAVALAAWHGRAEVSEDEVRDAARLAMPHRRRDPLDAPGRHEQAIDEALEAVRESGAPVDPDDDDPGRGPGGAPGGPGGAPGESGEAPPSQQAQGGSGQKTENGSMAGSRTAPADPPYRTRLIAVPGTGVGARAGRRSLAYTRSGRVVAARTPTGRPASVHLPATLSAAAANVAARGGLRVSAEDLREAVHVGREANLVLFVVDASGSMAARHRMRAVKGAVLSLLRDAYQRRDKVGLITFRGQRADLVLPPTTSHEVGAARLRELSTGGRTPIADALRTAGRTVQAHRRRDPHRRPLVVLVTDGRATAGEDPVTVASVLRGVATVVVDCESGPVRLGLAARLATALKAQYLRLDMICTQALRDIATRRAA
jgi:magnesium chelatase subunit D